MAAVDEAIEAIRSGRLAILPTDTVYGLCASPYREDPGRRLYALKGRDRFQPTALIVSDVEMLFECVPELRGRAGTIARAVFPGSYTLIFKNPARRYPWLTGRHPETIGVRVPVLPEPAKAVLDAVISVAATSANLPGEPSPRRLEDVPEQIRTGVGAAIDAGELPGVASTVIDCTGDEPHVAREGAGPAAEALERIRAALA